MCIRDSNHILRIIYFFGNCVSIFTYQNHFFKPKKPSRKVPSEGIATKKLWHVPLILKYHSPEFRWFPLNRTELKLIFWEIGSCAISGTKVTRGAPNLGEHSFSWYLITSLSLSPIGLWGRLACLNGQYPLLKISATLKEENDSHLFGAALHYRKTFHADDIHAYQRSEEKKKKVWNEENQNKWGLWKICSHN